MNVLILVYWKLKIVSMFQSTVIFSVSDLWSDSDGTQAAAGGHQLAAFEDSDGGARQATGLRCHCCRIFTYHAGNLSSDISCVSCHCSTHWRRGGVAEEQGGPLGGAQRSQFGAHQLPGRQGKDAAALRSGPVRVFMLWITVQA